MKHLIVNADLQDQGTILLEGSVLVESQGVRISCILLAATTAPLALMAITLHW